MPIPLLRFPLLVQANIFELMQLTYVFFLSTLSKRTRGIIQRSITQGLHLSINDERDFRLSRRETDFLRLEFKSLWSVGAKIFFKETPQYSLRNFLNVDMVPLKIGDNFHTIEAYWADQKAVFHPTIEHFATTFPQLKVNLKMKVSDVSRFLETIRLILSFNIELGHVFVWTSKWFDNELVKISLEECKEAESLSLNVLASSQFLYESEENFQFQKLDIPHPKWVTRNHITNRFIDCEYLTLGKVNFSYEDYKAIFLRWTEGCKMKKLVVRCFWGTIFSIFKGMEKAVEVRKAKILESMSSGYKTRKFKHGQAYQIAQVDGTRAIVYESLECLHLNTDFEIQDEDEADDDRVEGPLPAGLEFVQVDERANARLARYFADLDEDPSDDLIKYLEEVDLY